MEVSTAAAHEAAATEIAATEIMAKPKCDSQSKLPTLNKLNREVRLRVQRFPIMGPPLSQPLTKVGRSGGLMPTIRRRPVATPEAKTLLPLKTDDDKQANTPGPSGGR